MSAATNRPRVAVLSSADGGGAGIAARRLVEALASAGIAADLIDPETLGERLPEDVAPSGSLSSRRVSDVHFSVERPGFRRGWMVRLLAQYDVVNVHWAAGLVAVGELEALARLSRAADATLPVLPSGLLRGEAAAGLPPAGLLRDAPSGAAARGDLAGSDAGSDALRSDRLRDRAVDPDDPDPPDTGAGFGAGGGGTGGAGGGMTPKAGAARLVLTLHDFNALTGGCHYPGPCRGYEGRCLACPQVDRARASRADVARLRAVRAGLLRLPSVALTAPSAWLRRIAAAAAPGRTHLLRNPYRPLAPARGVAERRRDAAEARVLVVADQLTERRKNVALALAAVARFTADGGRCVVDLVGGNGEAARQTLLAAGVRHVAHGSLAEPLLTAVLRRADAVLLASSEDNWPNVLLEAGTFGATAVVGAGHGAQEFVERFGHGAVAGAATAEAFAAALGAALSAPPEAAVRAAAAVRAEHAPEAVAARFRALFFGGRAAADAARGAGAAGAGGRGDDGAG